MNNMSGFRGGFQPGGPGGFRGGGFRIPQQWGTGDQMQSFGGSPWGGQQSWGQNPQAAALRMYGGQMQKPNPGASIGGNPATQWQQTGGVDPAGPPGVPVQQAAQPKMGVTGGAGLVGAPGAAPTGAPMPGAGADWAQPAASPFNASGANNQNGGNGQDILSQINAAPNDGARFAMYRGLMGTGAGGNDLQARMAQQMGGQDKMNQWINQNELNSKQFQFNPQTRQVTNMLDPSFRHSF